MTFKHVSQISLNTSMWCKKDGKIFMLILGYVLLWWRGAFGGTELCD